MRIVSLVFAALLACIAVAVATVTQPVRWAAPSEPSKVDPRRLETHVKHLSVDLYPRSYDKADNLSRTADYIAQQFTTAGAKVSAQEVPVEGKTYKNIVGRFGPSSGSLKVIGAHYDSHGITPGADDNASGIAGLIELAHLLGKTTPAGPVELVAYTLEEPPYFRTEHMGSAWHARLLRQADEEVSFMLSLEMIGFFSDEPGSQHYPVPGMSALYSDRGNFIALVGNLSHFGVMRGIKATMAGATDLAVHSINAPALLQGIDFSDHLNYWQHGFPAFMVTDTAFMRNNNYHREGDTFETLDYERMAKVVQAVYAVAQLPSLHSKKLAR